MQGMTSFETFLAQFSECVEVEVCSDEDVHSEVEDVVCSPLLVPYVGMRFDTIEEAEQVYNDCALKMGFRIRVTSSRKSNVTKEVIMKE